MDRVAVGQSTPIGRSADASAKREQDDEEKKKTTYSDRGWKRTDAMLSSSLVSSFRSSSSW